MAFLGKSHRLLMLYFLLFLLLLHLLGLHQLISGWNFSCLTLCNIGLGFWLLLRLELLQKRIEGTIVWLWQYLFLFGSDIGVRFVKLNFSILGYFIEGWLVRDIWFSNHDICIELIIIGILCVNLPTSINFHWGFHIYCLLLGSPNRR